MACFSALGQGVAMCLRAILIGGTLGVLGPSLPDLARLHGVGTSSVAYVLLLYNVTGIVGNLIVPVLLKKASMYQLLAIMSLITSVSYAMTAFAETIYLVYVAMAIFGTVGLPAVTVIFLKMSKLFPNDPRPYYLALEGAALGGALSPLFLAPFLSDGIITRSIISSEVFNHSYDVRDASSRLSGGRSHQGLDSPVMVSSEFPSNNITIEDPHFITLLEIPFAVLGALYIPMTIVFLYFHYVEKSMEQPVDTKDKYESLDDDDKKDHQRTAAEYVLILVMFIYFLDGQLHTSYIALLPTYGTMKLNISNESMSFMTSLFWAAFLLSRLVPCFLSSNFKPFTILVIDNIGMCAAFISLIFAMNNQTFLWIASFALGLFYALRMPVSLAWTKNLIQDTPQLVSMKFIALAIGSTYSFLVGEVMGRVSVDAFVYMHIGAYVVNVSMFVVIVVICKLLKINVCV